MELDLKVIDRQVYNFLDWVGDIGGLGEGLFFMSITVLSIIHFGALDNQIIQELFRVNTTSGVVKNVPTTERNLTERDNPEGHLSRTPSVVTNLPKTSSFRLFLQYLCPKCCLFLCCKPNKRERIVERCRAQYVKEIDIVEHIMQFREIKAEFEGKVGPSNLNIRRSQI